MNKEFDLDKEVYIPTPKAKAAKNNIAKALNGKNKDVIIERLQAEIKTLKKAQGVLLAEAAHAGKVTEKQDAKLKALANDVKYLRGENAKMKTRLDTLLDTVATVVQQLEKLR